MVRAFRNQGRRDGLLHNETGAQQLSIVDRPVR